MSLTFLIDQNLPPYIAAWQTKEFAHAKTVGKSCKDNLLWQFAKEQNLIILTKDSDFSNRIIVSNPPPKVVHYRIGNMRAAELNQFIAKTWNEVLQLLETCKLVNVYPDTFEGFE